MQISYREECKRKLVHLSSLWMVVAILLLPGRWTAAILYAVMLVLNLLCEHAYACNVPVITPLYGAISATSRATGSGSSPAAPTYSPPPFSSRCSSAEFRPRQR